MMESNPFRQKARFRLGQIVNHSKFGYRGVIVDADPYFQGTDEWYQSVAKSRPDKNKPWYHILVHGQGYDTYVAEGILLRDASTDPIVHPFVEIFFDEYDNSGIYSLKQTFN